MKDSCFLKKKIIQPLVALLKQGLIPTKLAIVLALGVTLSVFPIFGTTTILCTTAALMFRLNLPAIQIANYLAFPIQLALFFLFVEIGEQITGQTLMEISKDTLVSAFDEGFFYAINELSNYLILACIGWTLSSVPVFFIFYYLFKIIINKYGKEFLPQQLG
ncbi:MAG: DUF2062 domain-containing protein [Nitrospinales bacterium]